MKLVYPVVLAPNGQGGFIVEFPDVPEALTEGASEAEALRWAEDALAVALSGYVDDNRDIPRPSRLGRGRHAVSLPPMAAAKLAIYQAMRDQRLTRADLAQRMGCDARQTRRLLDLDHNSRLDQLESALAALGKRLVVEVKDAA